MPFITFIISFVFAAAITPVIIAVYKKKGWVDHPGAKKHVKVIHEKPVPRGGGIVIFFATLITSLAFVAIDIKLFGVLVGASILMIVGTLDDIYDLNPYIRFLVCFVVALIVALSGTQLEYITHPFQPGVMHFNQLEGNVFGTEINLSTPFLPALLTIIWIMWSINIVNWSKGLDGQLPGVVGIAAFFIGVLALRFVNDPTQIPVLYFSFIVSGAFIGFLLWNAYPQKIMPGYGAGALGGYFLAVLSILSGAKLATALLVLGLPTADAMFTISRRLIAKKSPFWGDRGHLHHKLLDVLGWTKPQIALFYWVTTAILGIIALQLKPEQKVFTIGVVTALVFGFLIWVKLFITFSKRQDPDNG